MVTFNEGNDIEKQEFRVYKCTFSATITHVDYKFLTKSISTSL